LTQYLSVGKSAPINNILVDNLKLTSYSSMYNYNSELAGQIQLTVRAFNNIKLDQVKNGVFMAFDKFENEGINEKDLNRIKAGQETDFYTSLSSVLGKGTNLASYNTYTGDPGFLKQDIQNILSVTTDDVLRVYNKYIKGKNYLSTSFVPKNKVDLALEGSFLANVKEEEIIIGAETYFDPNKSSKYVKSPSSFDRTKEPDYGEPPSLNLPNIYRDKLANGMEIFGIQNNEVPLVNFNLTIEGGQLLESMDKLGLSNLTSKMLNKGTENKTVEELEKLIKELGASIYLSSTKENY